MVCIKLLQGLIINIASIFMNLKENWDKANYLLVKSWKETKKDLFGIFFKWPVVMVQLLRFLPKRQNVLQKGVYMHEILQKRIPKMDHKTFICGLKIMVLS